MASSKVYWVIKGRTPGLYYDWDSCRAQVNQFSGAWYKSFRSKQEYLDAKTKYDSGSDFVTSSTTNNASSDTNTKKETMNATDEAQKLAGQPTIVYTDGACQSVDGERVGGSGVWFGHGDERNISVLLPGEKQTSIRAELFAILLAMQQHLLYGAESPLSILSDSMYAVQGMNEWSKKWEAQNEWYRISNDDLWKQLLATRSKLKHGVTFEHVRAHCGIEGNEAADKLATSAVSEYRRGRAQKLRQKNA